MIAWLPTLIATGFGITTLLCLREVGDGVSRIGDIAEDLALAQASGVRAIQKGQALLAGPAKDVQSAVLTVRDAFGALGPGPVLTFMPGTERWRPSPRYLKALAMAFPEGASLTVYPRSEASRVLGRASEPYAFRAFTRGPDSFVFVDDTETPDSIAWLMAHELAHGQLEDAPRYRALLDARSPRLDPQSDLFHELDPEERYADSVAHQVTRLSLNRAWWRDRVKGR